MNSMPFRTTLISIFVIMLLSINSFAECEWTESRPIPNNDELYFQVCAENKTIKINDVEVNPTIPFQLIYPDCPECNTIWSKISPDKKTAVVYIENEHYDRNAWVIDLDMGKVELFTDLSVGKHFIVEFQNNNEFTITHAGMGYQIDYYYSNYEGVWVNTGHEEIDIKWQ